MTLSNKLKTVRSIPEQAVDWLPIPFWITWIIVWMSLFIVDFIYREPSVHSALTELSVILFGASVTICLVLSSKKMKMLFRDVTLFVDMDATELERWYVNKLHWTYTGLRPLLAGVALVVAVELTVGSTINSFSEGQPALLYFRMAYRVLAFFFLGMSIWSLGNIMLLPMYLLRFKLKVQLSNFSGVGLLALGNTFFSLSLMAVVTFSFLVLAILVSPLRNDSTVMIWTVLGCAVIFCFFFLPQVGIHRIMAKEKRQQILYYAAHLEEAIRRSHEDPKLENVQKLRELFDVQRHLQEMNEWPFNVVLVWQLISALLIPVLLVLIQILVQ